MTHPSKRKRRTIDAVGAYFQRLSPVQRRIAVRLRALIRRAAPDIREQIRWGNPTFSRQGDIFWIYALTNRYVSLGFFRGVKLLSIDQRHLIEGSGKTMRHIKVYSPQDIKPAYFSKLIRAAIKLDEKTNV